MNSQEEIILFEEIRNDNEKAFEKLFHNYYVHLCLFASQILQDNISAEEIVQDFFVKLWEKRKLLTIETSVKSYLFQSVKNLCLNFIQHRKIKLNYAQSVFSNTVDLQTNEDYFVEIDLAEKIEKSILSLPEKRQEIFRMSREDGLKYREIAKKLNISIKTVETQMGLAIKTLRDKLKNYNTFFILFEQDIQGKLNVHCHIRNMNEKMNIEDLSWELIAKHLNNETNSSENLEVENWLNQSDENRMKMKNCHKILNKIDGFYQAKIFDSNTAWKNVHSKINPRQLKIVQRKKVRKELIAKFYKYAAIIVVAILLGGFGYYLGFRKQMPAFYNEIVSAEKQVLNEYVLPDGSIVALNSNSKLEFPKQFASTTREVTIIGEAFFNVKPNPEKPFIINAGNTQVKVLGTSFNVCAYPETETVEVIVATGKVQVTQKNEDLLVQNNEVFLTPGEKGTLFNESNLLEKEVNADVNFLAWKTNDLVFDETPLSEVIRCLEKVYHIEIQLTEPDLENLLLTAHFNKKPINFVLDVVRLTFNLELTGENEHFTLASRNNVEVMP